ncbi:DUF3800 domain-containing protein [Deinococcus sp.]|uniref:DUF3800 domain-containing protein n=1 Tax=Deinococcus sp. TaxID=47478 RepID=UPI0025F447DA|nr:DUF3800 domain-containing protein [Deinococcus sp.]
MYVDESGDVGLVGSPTRYFILTGMVIHESYWMDAFDQLVAFRQRMKTLYGLKMKDEIHASALINKPGDLVRIKRNDRLSIIRNFADDISKIPGVSIINIVVDKNTKTSSYDVFETAWKTLIQRLENTINHKNFPHPEPDKSLRTDNECGMVIPDNTDDKKLRALLRKMRRYNMVPSIMGGSARSLPLKFIVEDPFFKDSASSYFIQACDTAAFLLYQNLQPNKYMIKSGGQNYFSRLSPVLCTVASPRSGGIVLL